MVWKNGIYILNKMLEVLFKKRQGKCFLYVDKEFFLLLFPQFVQEIWEKYLNWMVNERKTIGGMRNSPKSVNWSDC